MNYVWTLGVICLLGLCLHVEYFSEKTIHSSAHERVEIGVNQRPHSKVVHKWKGTIKGLTLLIGQEEQNCPGAL